MQVLSDDDSWIASTGNIMNLLKLSTISLALLIGCGSNANCKFTSFVEGFDQDKCVKDEDEDEESIIVPSKYDRARCTQLVEDIFSADSVISLFLDFSPDLGKIQCGKSTQDSSEPYLQKTILENEFMGEDFFATPCELDTPLEKYNIAMTYSRSNRTASFAVRDEESSVIMQGAMDKCSYEEGSE